MRELLVTIVAGLLLAAAVLYMVTSPASCRWEEVC